MSINVNGVGGPTNFSAVQNTIDSGAGSVNASDSFSSNGSSSSSGGSGDSNGFDWSDAMKGNMVGAVWSTMIAKDAKNKDTKKMCMDICIKGFLDMANSTKQQEQDDNKEIDQEEEQMYDSKIGGDTSTAEVGGGTGQSSSLGGSDSADV